MKKIISTVLGMVLAFSLYSSVANSAAKDCLLYTSDAADE